MTTASWARTSAEDVAQYAANSRLSSPRLRARPFLIRFDLIDYSCRAFESGSVSFTMHELLRTNLFMLISIYIYIYIHMCTHLRRFLQHSDSCLAACLRSPVFVFISVSNQASSHSRGLRTVTAWPGHSTSHLAVGDGEVGGSEVGGGQVSPSPGVTVPKHGGSSPVGGRSPVGGSEVGDGEVGEADSWQQRGAATRWMRSGRLISRYSVSAVVIDAKTTKSHKCAQLAENDAHFSPRWRPTLTFPREKFPLPFAKRRVSCKRPNPAPEMFGGYV